MTEERALKIGLNLQNIGYQVDDETLKKIKPFKDAIEAEILEELREQDQEEQKGEWVEITTRPLTDEEKEDEAFNEFDYIYTCETPDNAQDVLITTRNGYIAQTTFYTDYGCYFENFEELDDVLAWRPLPEPFYKEQKERKAQQ